MAEEREQQPSDLIQHPLLEAGRLMEDGSPEFALTWPEHRELQRKRIEILADLTDDLCSLALAAESLHLLNPRILSAITEGRQPVALTARRLMRQTSIPLDWHGQRAMFEFG